MPFSFSTPPIQRIPSRLASILALILIGRILSWTHFLYVRNESYGTGQLPTGQNQQIQLHLVNESDGDRVGKVYLGDSLCFLSLLLPLLILHMQLGRG